MNFSRSRLKHIVLEEALRCTHYLRFHDFPEKYVIIWNTIFSQVPYNDYSKSEMYPISMTADLARCITKGLRYTLLVIWKSW